MNEKKRRLLIFIFIALIIVILLLILLPFPLFKSDLTEEETQIPLTNDSDIKFNDSIILIRDAILSKNLSACNQVTNKSIRNECNIGVLDMMYYDNAIDQLDLKLCEKISLDIQKQSCISIVSSGIEHLMKQDPLQLSVNYFLSEDYEKAISIMSEYYEGNSNDYEVIVYLALAYANKAIVLNGDNDSIDKAFEFANKLVLMQPNNPESHRILGFVHEAAGNYRDAVDSYTKSLDINDTYILSYVNRAHVNNMQGFIDLALEDLKKAKELDVSKEYPNIYVNLCRLMSSNDEMIDDAISNCLISLETTQIPAEKRGAHLVLSNIYSRIDKFDEALIQLAMAKTYGDDVSLYNSYAQVYIEMEEYGLSEENALNALELNENSAAAYYYLAYSLYQQGLFDEAIIAANKGLEIIDDDISLLSPNKPPIRKSLYYTLANIYHILKDKDNEQKYASLGEVI